MACAYKPNMDFLAKYSVLGRVKTVPDGFAPGSDTANLSVLGFDPKTCYTGRSPLEALSMGVNLEEGDIATRLNFITLDDAPDFEDKILVDYSAGEISTEESRELIFALKSFFDSEDICLHAGISYRHCLVKKGGKIGTVYTPPHDITGKRIGDYLPIGEFATVARDMYLLANEILEDHPVNQKRKAEGKRPANGIWLWGEGTKPTLTSFAEKNGLKGGVVSAVDLLKGIAKASEMEIISVEGANGGLDTNYSGKADAALSALANGLDFVYIHIEAPDEMGHQRLLKEKIQAIENIDRDIVGPIYKELSYSGEDFAILICPDHPTPIEIGSHVSDPVPFMIYYSGSGQEKDVGFDEETCNKSDIFIKDGYRLLDEFIKGEFMEKEETLTTDNNVEELVSEAESTATETDEETTPDIKDDEESANTEEESVAEEALSEALPTAEDTPEAESLYATEAVSDDYVDDLEALVCKESEEPEAKPENETECDMSTSEHDAPIAVMDFDTPPVEESSVEPEAKSESEETAGEEETPLPETESDSAEDGAIIEKTTLVENEDNELVAEGDVTSLEEITSAEGEDKTEKASAKDKETTKKEKKPSKFALWCKKHVLLLVMLSLTLAVIGVLIGAHFYHTRNMVFVRKLEDIQEADSNKTILVFKNDITVNEDLNLSDFDLDLNEYTLTVNGKLSLEYTGEKNGFGSKLGFFTHKGFEKGGAIHANEIVINAPQGNLDIFADVKASSVSVVYKTANVGAVTLSVENLDLSGETITVNGELTGNTTLVGNMDIKGKVNAIKGGGHLVAFDGAEITKVQNAEKLSVYPNSKVESILNVQNVLILEKLNAPTTLNVVETDGRYVCFIGSVLNADKYVYTINNETYTTTSDEVILPDLAPGSYTLSVIASAEDEKYLDSDPITVTVEYIVKLQTPGVSINEDINGAVTLVITPVSGVTAPTAYQYTINGTKFDYTVPEGETNSRIDISEHITGVGTYTVYVTAKHSNNHYKDSDKVLTTYVKKVQLTKPVVSYTVDGDEVTFTWEAVENADYYLISYGNEKLYTKAESASFDFVEGQAFTVYAVGEGYFNDSETETKITSSGATPEIPENNTPEESNPEESNPEESNPEESNPEEVE